MNLEQAKKIFAESKGFAGWHQIEDDHLIEEISDEFAQFCLNQNAELSSIENKKQTLLASMVLQNGDMIFSKYAEILEINCDVTINGNRQQWQMDKFSLIALFYTLDKVLQQSELGTSGTVCNFNIKRYYDGLWGKTTLISIPFERILIHLSKLDSSPKYPSCTPQK